MCTIEAGICNKLKVVLKILFDDALLIALLSERTNFVVHVKTAQ
jgi:hypothetical protein